MILDELAAYASFRVAEAKKKIAADEMERKARSLPKGDFRFEHALCNTGVSFICEVKRASFQRVDCRRFSLCEDCQGI